MSELVWSFDFFDTLVTRNLRQPDDIFTLLALDGGPEEILKRRVAAERDLIRETGRHPSLPEIYLTAGAEPAQAERLAAAELAMERRVLRPRPAMVRKFKEAQQRGIRTAIASDTCYSEGEIVGLARDIAGLAPEMVLSSSSEGKSKANGRLFEVLAQRTGADPSRIRHYGDNPFGDIAQARSRGIEPELVPSPLNNFMGHHQHKVVAANLGRGLSAAESVSLAVIKNRFFDEPAPSAYSGDLQRFGYIAYGPLVLALAVWLIRLAEEKGMKTIHCLSRDGWLVANAINEMATHLGLSAQARYIHASRRMSKLISGYGREINEMSAARQRELYKDYLRAEGLSEGGLIFDIGYRGTTQRALSDLMQAEIHGAYIQTFPELEVTVPDWRDTTSAFLRGASRETNRLFQKYRQLHETVFSAPHGSFLQFDQAKAPVFDDNPSGEAVMTIHRGIADFIRDFLSAWPLDFSQISISRDYAFAHVHRHYRQPVDRRDVEMLCQLEFHDNESRIVKRAFVSEELEALHSAWPEGLQALRTSKSQKGIFGLIKTPIKYTIFHVAYIFTPSAPKKRKLQRDPYMYFAESRHAPLRSLKHLF